MRSLILTVAIIIITTLIIPASSLTVTVNRAESGKLYHAVPGGKVEVWFEIIYPDKLFLQDAEKGLGEVRVIVHCNWTLWNAIVSAYVVDENFSIDPTTFKPVEAENAWGGGGDAIGSANLIEAINAWNKPVGHANFTIHPYERYRGIRESEKAQLFIKITIALFDPDKKTKLPGGEIVLYTTSKTAPHVEVLPPVSGGDSGSASLDPRDPSFIGLVIAVASITAYLAYKKLK